MKDSIYLEEKKKFIEELRKLEDVQSLEKMKIINILIYILLIILIPIIVVLGFKLSNIPLYVIAGIVLIFGFIYAFINTSKCRKIVTRLMIENIVVFFNSNYGIRTISKKTKEEICGKINKLSTGNGLGDYVEHLIRFEKNGKDVDLVSYTEEEYPYRSDTLHFCNFILTSRIGKEGIFYLTCKDRDLISKKNKIVYDKIFWNYEKDINKMLNETGEKTKEEKCIELTEEQKSKLIEIYNKYTNPFTILIKDGYIYIKMRKYICNSVKCLEEIFDFENCLNDLLLNFV